MALSEYVQHAMSSLQILKPGWEASGSDVEAQGRDVRIRGVRSGALGAAKVSKRRCRRPPERHVLPADHPLVNDRLTFCMMVPYSSDNRCASALAISTRWNMHSCGSYVGSFALPPKPRCPAFDELFLVVFIVFNQIPVGRELAAG